MFEKEVVIDCRGHIMGRLASIIAKELLCGQKIVCVRAELAELSGSLYRNKRLSWFPFLSRVFPSTLFFTGVWLLLLCTD